MQEKVNELIQENRKFLSNLWQDTVKRANKQINVGRKRVDELRKNVTIDAEDIVGKLQRQGGEFETRSKALLGESLGKAFTVAKQVEALVVDSTEGALQKVSPVVDNNVPFLSKYVETAKDAIRKADGKFDELQGSLKKALATAGVSADAAPIAGYDQLTVKDVVEKAKALTSAEVRAIKTYEEAHKNRVTIVRELDAILHQAA